MKPLCIDLFCGLGGWTEGFLAEGYRVIGFDVEQHVYGEHRYPAQLVLQDVRTIHGKQFKDAAIIVASSPCPEYSYMAMPWSRAKQIAKALRGQADFPEGYTGSRSIEELNCLFEQPRRIQREAIAAAGGRFIPLIQENVRGAIPWVGRSQWHYGSFHLWGDVPALMPMTSTAKLGGGASWYPPSDPRHQPGLDFTRLAGAKCSGGSWFSDGNGSVITRNDPRDAGRKGGDRNAHRASGGVLRSGRFTSPDEQPTPSDGAKVGGDWFGSYAEQKAAGTISPGRMHGKNSSARKAASARIAKIPFPLANWIARVYKPHCEAVA